MADVFNFAWDVPSGGFRWVHTQSAPRGVGGTGDEGPFLTAVVPPFAGRRYAPLRDQPALFRIFAETLPTEEGILGFANQYGGLGPEVATRVLLSETADETNPNPWGWGESLDCWQKEILTMQRIVSLWAKVQAGDSVGLARHIYWERGDDKGERGVVYTNVPYVPSSVATRIKEEQAVSLASFGLRKATAGDIPPAEGSFHFAWIVNPGETHRFRPGDLGQPALWYIQQSINEYLTGRAPKRETERETERVAISPHLLWNPEMTELGLYLVPRSLLGAMWLQFAQAVAGNKSYRQCEYCRKWFEVSLEASRPTRLYCSNACRFKAYRKRQEDAYRLHQGKVPLKEIATRLGTNTTTAKGWIKKGKEK